jgi:hypothetical protein
LDPKFALAHCEYGRYFGAMAIAGALPANQALPLVRFQAQEALELDPSLPEGHAMLGWVAAFLDYDWKEVERHFRLAIARDPVPVFVRRNYAQAYLLPTGRTAEAVQQLGLALQEDPLNVFCELTGRSFSPRLAATRKLPRDIAKFWNSIRPWCLRNGAWPLTMRRVGSWTRRWHIAKRPTRSSRKPKWSDCSPQC